MQLVDQHNAHNPHLEDQTTFKFQNNELHFKREVNPELTDAEVNHAV